MTKQETAKLLTLINTHFQSFVVSAEIINGWHLILNEYSVDVTWAAYRAYIAQGKEFPPNVGQLVSLVKKSNESDSGAYYWGLLSGGRCKRSQLSDLAIRTFNLWGGRERMNSFPNPSNPWLDDPQMAINQISFARKEFIELFDSLYTQNDLNEVREISHAQARELLEKIDVTQKLCS